MSAVALPAARAVVAPASVWPLARIEALRYARHPLFLTGLAAALLAGAGEHGPIELDVQVIPSFFIGVLGVVVGARLTASTRRSGPVVDAAPTPVTSRTLAMCLACAVPALAGLLVVLVHHAFVLVSPIPEWHYGTYGALDRVLVTMVVPVIASAGGPLLGVAAGRWLRFPASSVAVVVVLLGWSTAGGYGPEQWMSDPGSLLARFLHAFSPYAAWGTGTLGAPGSESSEVLTSVVSYTGSPIWFAVWAVSLCVLAAAAALFRGSAGRARSRVVLVTSAAVVVAVAALVMSATHGNPQLYETNPTGTHPIEGASP